MKHNEHRDPQFYCWVLVYSFINHLQRDHQFVKFPDAIQLEAIPANKQKQGG